MIGLYDVKGTLSPGADADLVVLDEVKHGKVSELVLEQTWKFGVKVYDRHERCLLDGRIDTLATGLGC